MPDIDIKKEHTENIRHCNKCGILISAICNNGLSGIKSLQFPCLYKADNLNRYLLQCIIECYKEKDKKYIKPKIISDVKWDHYNKNYLPNNYELKDFILSDDSNVYLVHGEAGIGKSSFINELYLETALYSLTNGCNILPVFLRIEEFGYEDISPKDWMKKQLDDKYKYLNFEPAFFNPELSVVFFLDSVDDIQYVDYNDFQNKLDSWRRFIENSFRNYINIKFIISSRYLDYLSNFEIRNYARLFIQPFDDEQIALFVEDTNFEEQMQRQLLKTIEDNKDLPFIRNPFFLNKIISTPYDKIRNRTDIINTFLKSIFIKGNAFIRNRKTEKTVSGFTFFDVKLNGTTFFDALSKIAFNNQKANKFEVTMDEIEKIVHQDAKQFVDLAKHNSIFLKNSLRFTHPILQEYFAGRHIFTNISPNYKIKDIIVIDDMMRLTQPLKHLYNLLEDKERFVKLLITNNQLALAAECILEDVKPKFKEMVAREIVSKLNKYSNSIQEANTLGFFLGKLGDPRIISGLSYDGVIEPVVAPISSLANLKVGIYPVTNLEYSYFICDNGYSNREYWESSDSLNWLNFDTRIKSICSFWYRIQDKLNSDRNKFISLCRENNFDKELIAHLAFFKAIPREEFEQMIKALYSEEKNMKPLMWDIPTYNNPSQPVIGISIYEAWAYCCWLRKKTKKNYRLLTNEEWETVAGAKQKTYVYGNTLNTTISNTSETNINKNLPVGICRHNVSRDGIFDLTGNIFEWTSTIYKDDIDGMFKQYICKGGSWIHDASRARSSYIGRGMGWVRNLDVGFRICYDEN